MQRITPLLFCGLALLFWGCSEHPTTVPSSGADQFVETGATNTLLLDTQSAASIDVPADFATIQEAVDAASPGDVIKVAAGEYTEDVRVETDNIRIVADGVAIVIGGFTIVFADDVHIGGFTIRKGQNDGGLAGIHALQSNRLHIVRNTIEDVAVGVTLVSNSECLLQRNTVHSTDNAVQIVFTAQSHRVFENTVLSETGHGLMLSGPGNNFIRDNDFNDCGQAGIFVGGAGHNRIHGNSMNSNTNGLILTNGTDGNQILRNSANNNAESGITISSGAETANRLLLNQATGNGDCDIVDFGTDTRLLNNEANLVCPQVVTPAESEYRKMLR